MVAVLEKEVGTSEKGDMDSGSYGMYSPSVAGREELADREYHLFVEKYLEKPVYKGDPQMLTIPSASTFKGVPLLDDW